MLLRSTKKLSPILNGFYTYHNSIGDAYFKINEYRRALGQYLLALNKTSSPDIFVKCGNCYKSLYTYDSSEYYYGVAKKIEPYKFSHQFAFLQLFEQKKDTVRILQKANEIIGMPIKIESQKVDNIINYAKALKSKL